MDGFFNYNAIAIRINFFIFANVVKALIFIAT